MSQPSSSSAASLPIKITSDLTDYPRPDFHRRDLQWANLNGPWDFLFDDEDVGLAQQWYKGVLPSEVAVNESTSSVQEDNSIVQKIIGDTQELIKGNLQQQGAAATTNYKRSIKVPYVFQCPASGINDRGVHEVMWYQRSIVDPRSQEQRDRSDRVILHFEAVDYQTKVWVGGDYAGSHTGGHVPFDFDITHTLTGAEALITIRVFDSAYDLTQPRGKQYWGAKPESIFYTPSGGIWQDVWLEIVPVARIAPSSNGTVIRSDDIESGDLKATIAVLGRRVGQQYQVEIEASLGGVLVATSERKSLPRSANRAELTLNLRLSDELLAKLPPDLTASNPVDNLERWNDGLALWSPSHPTLYDLFIRLYDSTSNLVDSILTTTGMRSIDWTSTSGTILLNNRPLFQALCLDQGYWPETFMTPPSPCAIENDIHLAKAMGFNGCRKHQKVEDPRFLYHADRLGYLVWGEMANAYQFDATYAQRFNDEWIAAVKRDINHPCIVTWTPVNESWGYPDLAGSVEQRNHIRALYHITKSLDPTRPINDNCGWEHVKTDLTTFHDYADGPILHATCSSLDGILAHKSGRPIFLDALEPHDQGSAHAPGAPILCTEFGGVNIAPAHTEDRQSEWGYTTAKDPSELLEMVRGVVKAVVQGERICGFVYTQLTDIEQETNGLYTFARKPKLRPEDVKAVVDEAQKVYHAAVEARRKI